MSCLAGKLALQSVSMEEIPSPLINIDWRYPSMQEIYGENARTLVITQTSSMIHVIALHPGQAALSKNLICTHIFLNCIRNVLNIPWY